MIISTIEVDFAHLNLHVLRRFLLSLLHLLKSDTTIFLIARILVQKLYINVFTFQLLGPVSSPRVVKKNKPLAKKMARTMASKLSEDKSPSTVCPIFPLLITAILEIFCYEISARNGSVMK